MPNIETMQEKGTLWQERWNEICKLSKERNFDVIVTLQPYLGGGNKPLTDWGIFAGVIIILGIIYNEYKVNKI